MEFRFTFPFWSAQPLAAPPPVQHARASRIRAPDPVSAASPGARHQTSSGFAAEARERAALHARMVADDRPTGPPPAFEANLLEVESHWKATLARLETCRAALSSAIEPQETDVDPPDLSAQ